MARSYFRVLIPASSLLETLRARREPLWNLAREFGGRVIAIRTSCDDLACVRDRAAWRAADPSAPDYGVGVQAFLLTRDEVAAHPLEHDAEFWELGVEVVDVRTSTAPSITGAPAAYADARLVASVLEESGLLASSAAHAVPAPSRRAGAAT
ncbi:MAG TPA: hypothetical protein PKK06_03465 [Phycisphaerae bacterium]|nr:hypothetical protein [Phycisphaerae bacterium]HNU44744.1 hypothetical protein [Phycisphaerae bacterium]